MNINDMTSFYKENGYYIARNVIDKDLLEDAWNEFENLKEKDDLLEYSIYGKVHKGSELNNEQKNNYRVINIIARSPKAIELASGKFIVSFLKELNGNNLYNKINRN